MSTLADFRELTKGLGVNDDCPVCGYSWAGCQGPCVAHEALQGFPGPFHDAYNDDCPECKTCRMAGEPSK